METAASFLVSGAYLLLLFVSYKKYTRSIGFRRNVNQPRKTCEVFLSVSSSC